MKLLLLALLLVTGADFAINDGAATQRVWHGMVGLAHAVSRSFSDSVFSH